MSRRLTSVSMTSRTHKKSRSPEYSRHSRVTNLQILQSATKWNHLEHKATSLWNAYAAIVSEQAIILATNSSYVDPLLQFKSQLKRIKSSFKTVFAIPSHDKVKAMRNGQDEAYLEDLYTNIINIYEDTLLILVSKDLYKLQILKEMIVWMREDGSYLQARVMVIIHRVLKFASRKVTGYTSVAVPCMGALVAELSLLCSHTNPSIKLEATSGIYYILCIAKCQNEDILIAKQQTCGNCCFLPPSSGSELLPVYQGAQVEIAQNIGQTLFPSLLTDFVLSLLLELFVPDQVTATEAAAILKLTLEYQAHKITMVSKIVDAIYKQLYENSAHIMKDAMLHIITLLARTSPNKVVFQLMGYPVPADSTLILMWHAVSSESSVAPHVMKIILWILKGNPKEETLMDGRSFSLVATNMMPMMASEVLCMLLPASAYKKAVAQLFPQLLMTLMFQFFYSSNVGLVMEDSSYYAQDALRALLNCSRLQQVDIALKRKNFWNQDFQELYNQYWIYTAAQTLSEHNFPQFPETLNYLYKLSVEGPRKSEDRVITVIFLTEILNKFFKDPFPEEFLVLFKNWISDSSPAVSKLSLLKIGSMAPVINQIGSVCSLLLAILNAFLSKYKTVIIRALLTLRRILNKLDKVTYSSLCTRIASSYCPLMDHSERGIRIMAIYHFGELLRDMSQYTRILTEVILKALVPLILFLEDPDPRVMIECKHTLAICTSALNWPTSELLMDQYYNFELVVLNICNNIFIYHWRCITDLIYDTLEFLTSPRAYLRTAAVILLGYLATLGGHLLLREDTEVMFEAIDRVLRDEEPVIRELAEITHKLFKEVANKLTSSMVKEVFKKLKPLYNYKSPNYLTGSSMEVKETKNDKEVLSYKNYGGIF